VTIDEAINLQDTQVFVLAGDGFGPLEGDWQWRLVTLELGFTGTEWLAKVACYPESKQRYTKRLVTLDQTFTTKDQSSHRQQHRALEGASKTIAKTPQRATIMSHKKAKAVRQGLKPKTPDTRMRKLANGEVLKAWAGLKHRPLAVYQSRDFLAQVHPANGAAAFRVSINRKETTEKGTANWQDGITWDELQRIKSEIGMENFWAVEIFPPDHQVVNVANMRHLWVLNAPPNFAWMKAITLDPEYMDAGMSSLPEEISTR